MPTELRPNNIDQTEIAQSFNTTETALYSATQITPDSTTEATIILVSLQNMAAD